MTHFNEPNADADRARARDMHADMRQWQALRSAILNDVMVYVDGAIARALAAQNLAAMNYAATPPARPEPRAAPPVLEETLARAPFDMLPLPSWLQPFAMPENVRFTRTPDSVFRAQWASPAGIEPDKAAPLPMLEMVPAETPKPPAETPRPPTVRFTRTPDPKPVEPRPAVPDVQKVEAVVEVIEETRQPAPEPPAWFDALRMAGERPRHLADEQDNEGRSAVAEAPMPPDDAEAHDDRADGSDEETCEPVQPVLAWTAPPPVAAPAAVQRAPQRGSVARPPKKAEPAVWEDPPLDLLVEAPMPVGEVVSSGALEQNARLLEGVLEEFGVRGEIIDVRPGPVVTLYELEPAPGTKSSRVIGLSDDIARSMSAVSARVAVVQGRNVIGIELPNQTRETVFLRELVGNADFISSKHKLAIALGKTIGGEPIIVDLARMPHLLVAGTTGSGKSVAINTMILSILYRLRPEDCRLIMIDPKMLELSVYEGIPHLLTPVVTDPKKAVVALKWAVREMEDRYRKMAKVGVRNIDGFNARVAEAAKRGETITRTVQTGFNRETGEPIFEHEEMSLSKLPYIVLIVDEMADLMMVAGKDIESTIQRLAQMARAAGIHLITATQRPSVDVITGTIKANFPTRISFQVTSKIDSRTILGEQGAEQLLGQGDMLYMAGGGRIQRVHGPFVSDAEVEKVVAHLKAQGHPDYLDVVVAEEDGGDGDVDPAEKAVFDKGNFTGDDENDLYEQAVKVVLRDKKCSTSYIQRRLQVGYNKAASLVERMEKEGLVGQSNNAGKREILVYSRDLRFTETREREE